MVYQSSLKPYKNESFVSWIWTLYEKKIWETKLFICLM